MAREADAQNSAAVQGSVHIDVVSDVVCPWCYIGKRRLEGALALLPGVSVDINNLIEGFCHGPRS